MDKCSHFLSKLLQMNTEIRITSSFLDKIDIQASHCVLRMTGPISVKTGSDLCENLLNLDKRDMDFIPILIQSEGGDVDALLMILQTIEQCVTPIATICMSHCLSAAAVIFCMGSNGLRYMGPNSYLMFHEYSMGYGEAKGCDIQSVQSHFTKMDKQINAKIEKHMGISTNFFEQLGHVDTYMTAKDAYKHGIVDHIGYPTLRINFGMSMGITLKKGVRQEIDQSEKRPYKYIKIIAEPVYRTISVLEEDE
jgi:ATP-dependent Clp protease protease subunit